MATSDLIKNLKMVTIRTRRDVVVLAKLTKLTNSRSISDIRIFEINSTEKALRNGKSQTTVNKRLGIETIQVFAR